MLIFAVLFAVVFTTTTASISVTHQPFVADSSLPSQHYIPPVTNKESVTLADDGYRYKFVHKSKLGHHGDVTKDPSSEHLQPIREGEEEAAVPKPIPKEIAIIESTPEVKTDFAEDGYRYKTVRRLKYRHRRDVSELPASEYLPPVDSEEPVPEEIPSTVLPDVETELGEDGYRYRTIRRLKFRQRRDVNELPSSQYLPATNETEENVAVDQPGLKGVDTVDEVPANEYLPPAVDEQPKSEDIVSDELADEMKTDLAEDGYRYKTVRRLKYRQRRDVCELPANEYLPPADVEQSVSEEVRTTEAIPEVETELDKDGYRYKTVHQLKVRHRRDVNELPANQHLPSTEASQEKTFVAQPVADEVAVMDILPDNEYLPPVDVDQAKSEEVVSGVSDAEVKTELDEDGYRYKTVPRLKYRQRRDVNDLPASQYLPATKVAEEYVAVDQQNSEEIATTENHSPSFEVEQPKSEEVVSGELVPEVKTELAEDGYRYKTVRRLKYRQRRDVTESPASEYLPPTDTDHAVSEEDSAKESIPEADTELEDDGYRYKTVRKLKYRRH